jgi:precorrin-2 dehydrogenase/sirohydrochlorin ferrochelatase
VRYFPIELDVMGRDALVVGVAGEVISKIDRLLEAGARVTVVSADVHAGIEERAKSGRIVLLRRAFRDGDLEGKAIVFLAPADEAIARVLHDWATRTGRLVCAIDRPDLSTFVNPAVVAVENFTMSFGTGGTSPGTLRRMGEAAEGFRIEGRLRFPAWFERGEAPGGATPPAREEP